MTFTIHVMWFCAGAVELQDGKILSCLQVVKGCALKIISSKAQACLATKSIEQGEQCCVFFMANVDKERTATKIERLRQYISLTPGGNNIQLSGVTREQFVLPVTCSFGL